MDMILIFYSLLTVANGDCRSQVKCSDIEWSGSVWGTDGWKGVSLGAYTSDELTFIGCGPTTGTCGANTFYCNQEANSMKFGTTGSTSLTALRASLGPEIPTGAVACETKAPDTVDSATKLCQQLGYEKGSVIKVASSYCPEVYWDGKWTSDSASGDSHGQSITCTGKTCAPTLVPTLAPTLASKSPSKSPSKIPSKSPTSSSQTPSKSPTSSSQTPSKSPTSSSQTPSKSPSKIPSKSPSKIPSKSPTSSSQTPSKSPTESSDEASMEISNDSEDSGSDQFAMKTEEHDYDNSIVKETIQLDQISTFYAMVIFFTILNSILFLWCCIWKKNNQDTINKQEELPEKIIV